MTMRLGATALAAFLAFGVAACDDDSGTVAGTDDPNRTTAGQAGGAGTTPPGAAGNAWQPAR